MLKYYQKLKILVKELKKMKKAALLLAFALCFSCFAGLAVTAEAATEAQLTAPDIAYVNVQVTTNVAMLFAVPIDDSYNVENLDLLVWKGESESDKYDIDSADATLDPIGTSTIGTQPVLIFKYNGLKANQMTDVVYARTVVSDGNGGLAYSSIIDYSITEWGASYNSTAEDPTERENNNALVAALLEYGAAMQVLSNYYPNGYLANEAKSLKKITVTSTIKGEAVQRQVTQLVRAGETITLKAPKLDDHRVRSWSVEDANASLDGVQIEVNSDIEIDANFVMKAVSMWSAEFDKIEKSYISSAAGAGYNMVSKTKSIRIHSGSTAYSDTNTAYVSYVPKADGENKYLCLSSTAGGVIYVNDGSQSSIIPSNYNAKESGFITITFSLKRNEAGRIINSLGLRIRAKEAKVAENMRVFNTKADGTVNIAVYKGGSSNSYIETKVGEVAENGWSHFAFVVDFDELKIYGYMKDENGAWQHTATSDVCIPANYTDIYDWLANVGKMEWEFTNSEIDAKTWETIVPEADRQYVEGKVWSEADGAYIHDTTLTSEQRKERLGEIVEKYFSVNIDNYEIFSGYAID